MLKRLLSRGWLIILLSVTLLGCDRATTRPQLSLAGSLYVGWMPWYLAAEDGTLAKYAQKNQLDIEFIRGDYIETINQFAAGGVDAVVLTNVDALALLANAGVATDVILIGSYSAGNDAVFMRPTATPELAGKTLGLVEYSVSHYLLERCMQQQQQPLDAVRRLNIADSEIAAAFAAPGTELDGVVTWNPISRQIEQRFGGKKVCDSRQIEHEIADMLVVKRDTLNQHPGFAQALLHTWFDITGRLAGPQAKATRQRLGELSGTDGAAYQAQLADTELLAQPEAALRALQDPQMQQTMKRVQRFVQRHQLVPNAGPATSVSYQRPKAAIHMNAQPLQHYVQQQTRP